MNRLLNNKSKDAYTPYQNSSNLLNDRKSKNHSRLNSLSQTKERPTNPQYKEPVLQTGLRGERKALTPNRICQKDKLDKSKINQYKIILKK